MCNFRSSNMKQKLHNSQSRNRSCCEVCVLSLCQLYLVLLIIVVLTGTLLVGELNWEDRLVKMLSTCTLQRTQLNENETPVQSLKIVFLLTCLLFQDKEMNGILDLRLLIMSWLSPLFLCLNLAQLSIHFLPVDSVQTTHTVNIIFRGSAYSLSSQQLSVS